MLIKYFNLFFTAVSARLKHNSKIRCSKKKRYDYYRNCFRNGYKSIKSCIVFRVVTSHYVSRNRNKYAASCHQIHKKFICPEHFTDNIERKYFRSALKRRLSNKMIYSKEIIVLGRPRYRWKYSSFPWKLYGISVNLRSGAIFVSLWKWHSSGQGETKF